MQRRVVKGRPEVKDALGDFGKLGQRRTILSLLFFLSSQQIISCTRPALQIAARPTQTRVYWHTLADRLCVSAR